jgi:DNA-binding CsgD family transcriptional regulator
MFSRQNINQLKGSDILIKISDKLKPEPQKEKKVSEEEWAELIEKVRNCIPIFYYNITKNSSLTNQEKQTAILLLLDYSNKDISILLDTSKSRISNIRSGINLKLFGTHSALHVESRLKELLTVG